jgi:hypothetical protein
MAELAIDITNGELTIVSGLVWVVSWCSLWDRRVWISHYGAVHPWSICCHKQWQFINNFFLLQTMTIYQQILLPQNEICCVHNCFCYISMFKIVRQFLLHFTSFYRFMKQMLQNNITFMKMLHTHKMLSLRLLFAAMIKFLQQ